MFERFERVTSVDAFVRARGPRAYVCDTLIAATDGGALQLLAPLGEPSEACSEELVTISGAADLSVGASATLVDLSGLREVSAARYEMLFGFVALLTIRHAEGHRTAIVTSGVSAAATALGYAVLAEDMRGQRAFVEGPDALAFLGVEHPEPLWQAWRALGEAPAADAWLATVRARIRSDYRGVRLADCAQGLGMSERAFQRVLEARGLVFRELLARERVDRARELLDAGETKLLWIAAESGFGKVEAMNAAFERVCGVLPRDLVRRGPPGARPSAPPKDGR